MLALTIERRYAQDEQPTEGPDHHILAQIMGRALPLMPPGISEKILVGVIGERPSATPYIAVELRESSDGREAYVIGTGLAVWEVMMVAGDYEWDADRVADHLRWPIERVKAALRYTQNHPKEIQAALEENDGYDFMTLSRLLPHAQQFVIDESSATAE